MERNVGHTVKNTNEIKNPKLYLLFVTGTSGAGKTTLKDSLQHLNNEFISIHDFDEWGIPEDVDENFRIKRTGEWIEYGVKNMKENHKSTVLFGQVVPHEVMDWVNQYDNINTAFGFIDVDLKDIENRLHERGWEPQLIEANLIWSSHLKRFTEAQPDHVIYESQGKTKEEVAAFFEKWIMYKLCVRSN
ncbi:AAA family ATPase [Chengkuizengella axinellae]|uniref:AAA family ATPase n=1 Tax=Chengkuizengella axinellae TaxID=3064388 RepID=A0ABT9IU94_9BACL|nr:AAA family ATPase [Chengkuizengella sp. 2205SS18-9]MDP5272877.1 AAA family ATPase [Chengkuizengella sp. 2205SS18-9]